MKDLGFRVQGTWGLWLSRLRLCMGFKGTLAFTVEFVTAPKQ